METTSTLTIKGWVDIDLRDVQGRNRRRTNIRRRMPNVVTNVGKAFFASKIVDDPTLMDVIVSDIALGDNQGSVPADVLNTELSSEFFRKNLINRYTDPGSNIARYRTIVTIGEGEGNVQELGLFSSNDLLLCRVVLSVPFIKQLDEHLIITWSIQIGESVIV